MEYRQLNNQASRESTNDDLSGLVGGDSGTVQQRFMRSLSSITRPTTPLQAERLRWLKIGGVVLVVVLILSIVIAASVNRHKDKAHPIASLLNVTIEGKSHLSEGEKSSFKCSAFGGKDPYTISLSRHVEHQSGRRENTAFPKLDTINVTARTGYKNITLICHVVDAGGNSAQAVKVINVTAAPAPLKATIQGESKLKDGQTSTMSCSVQGGIPPYQITFHEADKEEVKGHTLIVTADKSHKKITLICNVKDSKGDTDQDTQTITVLVGPDPTLVHLLHMGKNTTVLSGSTQDYECISGGATPAPTIAWEVRDQTGKKQLFNETSNSPSERGGHSMIQIFMKENWTKLNISCVVSNNVSAVKRSLLVNIVPKKVPQKDTVFGTNRTFMLVVSISGEKSQISQIDLDSPNPSLININITSPKHAYDLEFDYEDQCLFWANNKPGQILTKCFKNKTQEFTNETVILSDPSLGTIEAMAYDQTSKILYFLDAQNASIEMMKISPNKSATECHQQMRTKVLQISDAGSRSKPRGLALHPAKGYLFYSDRDRSLSRQMYGYIGRSELDGSNHKKIVNKDRNNKDFVNSPSHLTVDVVADRLFWIDFANKQISNSNLDGRDLKQIKPSNLRVPFSIALLAKKVYWSEKNSKNIFVVDEKETNSSELVSTGNALPYGIKIYSPLSRTPSTGCSGNRCSHLCIARPVNSNKTHSCHCPAQMLRKTKDGPCTCPDMKWKQGKCSDRQFECPGSGHCIIRNWRCDGEDDCPDGADEQDCTNKQKTETSTQGSLPSSSSSSSTAKPNSWYHYDYEEYSDEDEIMAGRPLIVDGKSRTTHSERHILPEMKKSGASPSVSPRNPHIQDIGRQWLRHAEAEHASVASFARHTLQLMSLGAPSWLLVASQQASLDEIRHTQICYGFASAFLGSNLGPGSLDVQGSLQSVDVNQIVRSLIVEGCIGETLSAMEVHLAAQYATDASVKAALGEIAADETKHSQLAWDTLVWILEKFPDTQRFVKDTFQDELEDRLTPARNESSFQASLLCSKSEKDSAFHKYGLLVKADRDKIQQVGIKEIIGPVFDAGFQNVKLISEQIAELDIAVLTHGWEKSGSGFCRG